MKPRVRAYSLDHYKWHYNESSFSIDYYNSDEFRVYVQMRKAWWVMLDLLNN